MPRSRVCPSCGHDTAGTAPEIEPHYGWTIVRCAACPAIIQTCREAGHVGWWRLVRRWRAASLEMLVQAVSVFLVVAALPFALIALHRSLASFHVDAYSVAYVAGREGDPSRRLSIAQRLADWKESGDLPLFTTAVGLAAFAGIWIGAMLRHCRVVRAWAVVAGLVLASTEFIALMEWAYGPSVMAYRTGAMSGAPVWAGAFGEGVLAMVAMAFCALAIPLGGGVGLVLAEIRRFMFQVVVRRVRRRRQR